VPTSRKTGFTGILAGVIGVAAVLPGCDGGGGAVSTGPNPEVKLLPIKDASGKEQDLSKEVTRHR
jgi:hypothetical protein